MSVGNNIILSTDSYKQTHWAMYPPGCTRIGSYFEARAGGEYPEVVFFGLQYLISKYFSGVRVTDKDILDADEFCRGHFGQELFNREGWEYILREHEGRLPVRIRAVPEGTVVPESNVLFTIENTDPNVPWLVNHLETLLVQLWYPCTVATISRAQKDVLREGLLKSVGSDDKLSFMLHDFGYRGSTSVESAAIGGAAHLVNFIGTDNIAAIELMESYYGTEMAGYSVPAAEHSTITAWGETGEVDAYRHILNRFSTGIVSVVSDSWDIFEACEKLWGGELKTEVEGDGSRTLVVRPDSGDPNVVVPRCLQILGDKFGFTVNDQNYKELPHYVRVIQGDGISRSSLPGLVDSILGAGWALDNLVFGSGGGLLQDCNRDTQRFALKACWAEVGGEMRDVYKRPASDATKNSKRGRIKLVRAGDSFETVGIDDPRDDVLYTVFEDGYVLSGELLVEIRRNADPSMIG